MADTYTEIANALETIINDEFAPEGVTASHDRLHESIGHEGARVGISIENQVEISGSVVELDTEVLVQYYGKYDLEINPKQKVDPRKIAALGDRLRTAINTATVPSTDTLWYFWVSNIAYPNDPTGNKSRFEATIFAKATNNALVETAE